MAIKIPNSFYGRAALFGFGDLASSQAQSAYNRQMEQAIDAQIFAAQKAQMEREIRAYPGDWHYVRADASIFSDVDKYGKTGIEAMENERPIKALRREIEGWLPKLD